MFHMPTTSDTALTPVTVLGLGAMGRALAGAFLKAGHPTTVWNRSKGRGDDLAARGAVVAETAEDAVRAAELIVVCVVDYDAAEAILAPLEDALQGRVLVNVTSDVPERSRAMAAWAAEHSIAYLDGAVMVPTGVVGGEDALLFYSGSRESFERYESTLKALGVRAAFVGEEPGRAAAYDLSLLDFFYGSISGLVHAFALAKAEGVEAADIAPYMDTTVSILPPIAEYTAANIDARSYPGAEANLGMMAASVDHILHAAEARGLDVSQLAGIKRVADRALARGHAADDWASTYEAIVKP
ncbi:NAD(P)-dependent oxidoreductase [Streptomyces katsurahamanus]|uniref:NAD(P)-dependent oxidoreductase n=2 Tax=Streptomyces katsurahamanus TaxID=2577098 RepID=A0ABW9NR09_9ACTN|nr:NAD(P)-binding domain-containing protein [Streptomyces katsurahamanus]MQS35736.1 NAD(P)-dependent oxidoreductase [Streptomyces katsurahamanus]